MIKLLPANFHPSECQKSRIFSLIESSRFRQVEMPPVKKERYFFKHFLRYIRLKKVNEC